MLTDELHQCESGARRKLQALVLVEPKCLASCADIDGDGRGQVRFQCHGGYFRYAVWTLHRELALVSSKVFYFQTSFSHGTA